jgi:hypothetical protein
MRGQLDLLVPPLRRAVLAGDQPHPVKPPEVAVDEGVPGLPHSLWSTYCRASMSCRARATPRSLTEYEAMA